MGYTEPHLWVDGPETSVNDWIGEHEGYGTLYDVANDRYLGNHVPWAESLAVFLGNREEDPEWLRDLLDNRFRVVPRCKCTVASYGGTEWTGSKHGIIRDPEGGVDFAATEQDVLAAWRAHVESVRAALAERQAAAAKQQANYLVALDHFATLEPAERLSAVRKARTILDTVETETVIQERRRGRTWDEIGAQLGTSKQAARRRFVKVDPMGAEAA